MGAWVKAIVVAATVLGWPSLAHSDDDDDVETRIAPTRHWLIGVTFDRRISSRPFREGSSEEVEDQSLIRDQLFGVSATHQWSRLGLNGRLVFLPSQISPRTTVGLSLGALVRFTAFNRDWTAGLNAQGDAVLGDHHWILYASGELGFDVYTKRSLHVQLVVGARGAFAGDIIKNVVIDPNGFAHPKFDMIKDDKLAYPFEGTVSAVFARRID